MEDRKIEFDLTHPAGIKHVLAHYGFLAKKAFDQNFLIEPHIVQATISALGKIHAARVVEVGAGLGVLTSELLHRGAKVRAVEVDREMAVILRERFGLNPQFSLIEDDIRHVDFSLIERPWKFVGNLPYSITGQILRILTEMENTPERVVLMMQKEVAQRLCEKVGRLSKLAVIIQLWGTVEIVVYVRARSFWPAPRVDSAVVRLLPGKRPARWKEIIRFVKIGFASPRQTLKNNLTAVYGTHARGIERIFETVGIPQRARGQELPVQKWIELERQMADM